MFGYYARYITRMPRGVHGPAAICPTETKKAGALWRRLCCMEPEGQKLRFSEMLTVFCDFFVAKLPDESSNRPGIFAVS